MHIPAGSLSPEFDPAFANEADVMFSFGQPPVSQASSTEQLQRRLRLSDVGLAQPTPAQAPPEVALVIKARTDILLVL